MFKNSSREKPFDTTYEKAIDDAIDSAAKAQSVKGRLKNALSDLIGGESVASNTGFAEQIRATDEMGAKNEAEREARHKRYSEFLDRIGPEKAKLYEEKARSIRDTIGEARLKAHDEYADSNLNKYKEILLELGEEEEAKYVALNEEFGEKE